MQPSETQAALLGSLASRRRGMRAREIAVWVDTSCQRARALGSVGLSGRGYRRSVLGEDAPLQVSPFASEVGARHEFLLTRDGEDGPASLLRSLYADALGVVVPGTAEAVRDFDKDPDLPVPERSGDKDEDRRLHHERDQEVARRTKEAILSAGGGPMLLLQACVPFSLAGTEHLVKPDVLLWTGVSWRVGEMKAYLDRGGYTESSAVAKAVKQCAVGVVALRQMLQDHQPVESTVDLFLRATGRVPATIRSLLAEAEIAAVMWADRQAPAEAEMFLRLTDGRSLDEPDALKLIPHEFSSECHGSCGLAEECEREAVSRKFDRLGPNLFGHLGISNDRAGELASGAEPRSESERTLALVLRDAWNATEDT